MNYAHTEPSLSIKISQPPHKPRVGKALNNNCIQISYIQTMTKKKKTQFAVPILHYQQTKKKLFKISHRAAFQPWEQRCNNSGGTSKVVHTSPESEY